MKKILFAVVGCEKRWPQMMAQRSTWVKDVELADVRFFLGQQDREAEDDEVFLAVGDDYGDLPAKVRAVSRWALGQCYERVLKLDDDVVVFPTRVMVPTGPYVGWKQEPVGDNWCSGLAYWLSRRAMEAVANAELTTEPSEDRWTGKVLLKAGIRVEGTTGIRMVRNKQCRMPPNVQAHLGHLYAAGEFTASEMLQVYR